MVGDRGLQVEPVPDTAQLPGVQRPHHHPPGARIGRPRQRPQRPHAAGDVGRRAFDRIGRRLGQAVGEPAAPGLQQSEGVARRVRLRILRRRDVEFVDKRLRSGRAVVAREQGDRRLTDPGQRVGEPDPLGREPPHQRLALEREQKGVLAGPPGQHGQASAGRGRKRHRLQIRGEAGRWQHPQPGRPRIRFGRREAVLWLFAEARDAQRMAGQPRELSGRAVQRPDAAARNRRQPIGREVRGDDPRRRPAVAPIHHHHPVVAGDVEDVVVAESQVGGLRHAGRIVRRHGDRRRSLREPAGQDLARGRVPPGEAAAPVAHRRGLLRPASRQHLVLDQRRRRLLAVQPHEARVRAPVQVLGRRIGRRIRPEPEGRGVGDLPEAEAVHVHQQVSGTTGTATPVPATLDAGGRVLEAVAPSPTASIASSGSCQRSSGIRARPVESSAT